MLESARNVSHHTHDDAFHEIQLNGKQLFFLFMAATVVSVVIFLCGVLVGRGVQAERRVVAENAAVSAPPSADVQPQAAAAAASASAGADLTVVPPPPAADDLAIVQSNASTANASTDRPAASPAKADKQRAPARDHAPARDQKMSSAGPVARDQSPAPPENGLATPAKGAASAASPKAQAGDGWVVQVAALNVRSEADAFAKSLSTKGYGAYVVSPQSGVSFYRVRVGGFKTRRDADTAAEKLRKEGQKAWVTTR